MDLPVSAMPLYDSEIFCVYHTKKRPAIIISKGGAFVEKGLTKGKSKWRTDRTILLVPSYSVREAFSEEFCDRVRRCEYAQFMWDDLPIGGTEKGSVIRFDHLQPAGRSKKSIEFTRAMVLAGLSSPSHRRHRPQSLFLQQIPSLLRSHPRIQHILGAGLTGREISVNTDIGVALKERIRCSKSTASASALENQPESIKMPALLITA